MFSKEATKIDKIFTIDLIWWRFCQFLWSSWKTRTLHTINKCKFLTMSQHGPISDFVVVIIGSNLKPKNLICMLKLKQSLICMLKLKSILNCTLKFRWNLIRMRKFGCKLSWLYEFLLAYMLRVILTQNNLETI